MLKFYPVIMSGEELKDFMDMLEISKESNRKHSCPLGIKEDDRIKNEYNQLLK